MSFSTLPPELLTSIIIRVDPADLFNLRLVSRNLQIISTPVFGEKCLYSLAFMFSEHSLGHLVQLTESELGRHVKKIMFGTHVLKIRTEEELAWEEREMQGDEEDELTEGELEELDRGIAVMEGDYEEDETGHSEESSFRSGHGFHISDTSAATELDDSDPYIGSDDANTTRDDHYLRLEDFPPQDSAEYKTMPHSTIKFQQKAIAMTRFLDSGRHVRLMTEAFANLKHRGVEVTLGFIDDAVFVDKDGRELWCLGRKCHGFDESYNGRLNCNRSSPMNPDHRRLLPDLVFRSILKAAETAGYPVKSLQFDLVEGKSWPLSEQDGVQIPLERWLFEPRRQTSNLDDDDDGVSTLTPGLEWKVNAVLEQGILAHLHVSTDKRSLRFSSIDLAAKRDEPHTRRQKAQFSSLYDYGMYAMSLGDHAFVEISLRCCSVDIADMMDFLRSQRKSLRYLTLAQVDLDFDDPPSEHESTPLAFLKLMRNTLQLEYLMTAEIRSAEHKFRFIGGRSNIWTTKGEIQDGLQAELHREEIGKYFVDAEYLKHQPSMLDLVAVDEDGDGEKSLDEHGEDGGGDGYLPDAGAPESMYAADPTVARHQCIAMPFLRAMGV